MEHMRIDVLSTEDYSQFKPVMGNRKLSSGHIQKLVHAIEEQDLTQSRPILVNENLEIIDGQHRFEACKQLGLPIYYQVQVGGNSYHAASLNATQAAWDDTNYMDHLKAHGDPTITSLNNFLQTHGISVSVLIGCITADARSRQWSRSLRSGKLDPAYWENSEIIERIGRWKEFLAVAIPSVPQSISKRFLQQSSCIVSLIRFMYLLGCNWHQFLNNIQMGCQVRPCRTIEQYMDMFVDIHNYKQKDRLQFRPGQFRDQTEYRNRASYKLYNSKAAEETAEKVVGLSFTIS